MICCSCRIRLSGWDWVKEEKQINVPCYVWTFQTAVAVQNNPSASWCSELIPALWKLGHQCSSAGGNQPLQKPAGSREKPCEPHMFLEGLLDAWVMPRCSNSVNQGVVRGLCVNFFLPSQEAFWFFADNIVGNRYVGTLGHSFYLCWSSECQN